MKDDLLIPHCIYTFNTNLESIIFSCMLSIVKIFPKAAVQTMNATLERKILLGRKQPSTPAVYLERSTISSKYNDQTILERKTRRKNKSNTLIQYSMKEEGFNFKYILFTSLETSGILSNLNSDSRGNFYSMTKLSLQCPTLLFIC